LGASEKRANADVLFTPVADTIIRLAPCPVMIVQGHQAHRRDDWVPDQIMVPSNGSQASRRAAEVAYAIINDKEEQHVTVLHVVEENRSNYNLDASGTLLERQKQTAIEGVNKLRDIGVMQDLNVSARVEVGAEPETVILEMARKHNMDLIILG